MGQSLAHDDTGVLLPMQVCQQPSTGPLQSEGCAPEPPVDDVVPLVEEVLPFEVAPLVFVLAVVPPEPVLVLHWHVPKVPSLPHTCAPDLPSVQVQAAL